MLRTERLPDDRHLPDLVVFRAVSGGAGNVKRGWQHPNALSNPVLRRFLPRLCRPSGCVRFSYTQDNVNVAKLPRTIVQQIELNFVYK